MAQRITQAEWRVTRPRRKPRVEREHEEQKALFKWARLTEKHIPELALLFAIPNGGHRHKAVAAKLRAEGVRAGVPDLFLPVACGIFHGLFIELKAKGGRTTETQGEWLQALWSRGYCTAVCYGWEAAKDEIEEYLRYGPPLGEGVM
jgi:hypothetical protein